MQRRQWFNANVGHAGTLDPLASGLMILCTGKKTKTISELTGLDKSYEGEIQFGWETETYDLESVPKNETDCSELNAISIEQQLEQFRGDIIQYAPMHSAVKQDGKKLYQLARKGIEVKRRPRPQTVHSFQLHSFSNGLMKFKVHCSSGTYIRSLAHDLGQALEVGAYLKSLVRTSIGPYELKNAYTLDELAEHFGSRAKLKTIEPKI